MYAFLEQANERVPSAEEIAKELDMTVSDVKESMKNSGRHVSMDAPLVEGEDSNLYDVIESGESPNPDKKLLHESLKTEIERSLETRHQGKFRRRKIIFWFKRSTCYDLGRNW